MAREMKDSGVEWIGKIPKDWKVIKVKKLFHIGRGRVISKLELKEDGYPVYSSQTKNNGILGYIETYDFDKSQITWTTDGANAGTVFLREGKYNCTNVCGTLLPKKENEKLKFVEFALKFIAPYYKRADINGFKIMNNEMAEIPIIYPPLEEQEKIANYLNKKVVDIDLIIEKTKTTIEDYKKYKQSIITEAVTKGLNPNVEMKNSGIEWIGEIPKHWKKINPKALFYQRKDRAKKDDRQLTASQKYGIMYQDEFMEKEGVRVTVVQKDFDILKHVEPNDFVISMRSFQGGLEYSELSGCISSAYDMLIPNLDKVYPKFFFKSFKYINALQSTSNLVRDGQAMRYSNFSQLYLVEIPLEEQKEIAEYLDKKVAEIDNLIAKKESLISEMEEYKKSLIYECVTGKKEII